MTDKHLPEDTSRGEETTLAQRDRAGLPVARRELAKLDPAALEHADKILIEGLEVFANHGGRLHPAETPSLGRSSSSRRFHTSLRQAGKTDDLDASINYGEVCHTIDAYLRAHTFKLIEAAAEATAERLLADYPALIAVRLRIAKPWAPIGLPLSSVAVEIERTR